MTPLPTEFAGDTGQALRARVLELIAMHERAPLGRPGDTHPRHSEDTHPQTHTDSGPSLGALLTDLAVFQAARVAPYGRLCAARSDVEGEWAPALPTDAFRFARIAGFPAAEDTHVFKTSGTSSGARGAHAFRDLSLYDAAARAHARQMLFPDVARMRLVMLAEHPDRAPESSLSYMLGRFETWFGAAPVAWCLRGSTLDTHKLRESLESAAAHCEPVALLGTSFAFVFAEDALGEHRFVLPEGSRIMQTGGYKGRSREVEPGLLRDLLGARYGIEQAKIVAEYGMTELSSQLYEASLRDHFEGHPSPRRHLVAPPWVRATPVDPQSLRPLPPGEVGVLRIDDAANVDSVTAILTSDLAETTPEGGVLLHGRAHGSTLRGCSLSVEEALGRHVQAPADKADDSARRGGQGTGDTGDGAGDTHCATNRPGTPIGDE